MADNDTHARQRRALSHGFSQQALWGQEEIVQGYITKLLNNIRSFAEQGKSFNIVDWYNFLTFDVIGDLAFRESFGCLERGDFHFWITLIFKAVQAGALETATRRFAAAGSPLQSYLMRWIPNEMRKQRADHLAYSREKVMKRLSDTKSDRKDFTHYILRQAKRVDLSQDEIIVNGALFIVAGSETTAMTLSAMTNFLIAHPDKFDKLKKEIRGSFRSESEITVEKATVLQYLNGCIEETLRMLPPAPIGFLRSIPAGGDTIAGEYLPAGVRSSVPGKMNIADRARQRFLSAHGVHSTTRPTSRTPILLSLKGGLIPHTQVITNWPAAPSRLDRVVVLGRSKQIRYVIAQLILISHSLAYMEMRVAFCRLFWLYDITTTDGAPDWDTAGQMKNMKAYSTWVKPELNVRATPVQR